MNGLEQFEKQPVSVKIAILAVLVVVIAVLEYQLFFSPKKQEMADLSKQTVALKVKLSENEAIANNLPRFREEVTILDEELKRALELLPNEADVQRLYRDLSTEAKKTNVELLKFRPGGQVNQGFYASLSMDITVSGAFHEIASFIDHVGRLSRIVNVSNLNFSAPKVAGDVINVDVNCKVTTFMFAGSR